MGKKPIVQTISELEVTHNITYTEMRNIIDMHPTRNQIFENMADTLGQTPKYVAGVFRHKYPSKNVLWLLFPIAAKLKVETDVMAQEIIDLAKN